jgi:hypothetical protein
MRQSGSRALYTTRRYGFLKQCCSTIDGTLVTSGPSWMSHTALLNSKWTQEFAHISENLVPESNFLLACNVHIYTRSNNPISEGGLHS